MADLQHADLTGADLQHAFLQQANLQGAYLIIGANLQQADFSWAKLQHASLGYALGLEEARLENVDWGEGYKLGEEERRLYSQAEAVYRRLKQYYNRSGQYDHAGEFHFREMECRRKGVQEKVRGWWKVWKAWGR